MGGLLVGWFLCGLLRRLLGWLVDWLVGWLGAGTESYEKDAE